MQRGDTADEWAVGEHAGEPDALPFQHVAARVSGIPHDVDPSRVRLAWSGISNAHTDPVDAWRLFGSPIIYIPRISERALADKRYKPRHALPSSDLIWCENNCRGFDGARAVRIVTCTHGWVTIVCAHYESQLHGGSFPCGPDGQVMDCERGEPYLAGLLLPGVELLRIVAYSLTRVDTWCMSVQAAYQARADASGVVNERQRELINEVYFALDAPLDERFRMLHPWLPSKRDDLYSSHSTPFGLRPKHRLV